MAIVKTFIFLGFCILVPFIVIYAIRRMKKCQEDIEAYERYMNDENL